MPKKAPKNAYYYFMREYMLEQNKQGKEMKMSDANLEAGPIWTKMPAIARAKYEAIAKREKEKRNIPLAKYTSTGESFEELDNRERAIKEALERENKDIQNFVAQNTFNMQILDRHIYIIDVNSYCETNRGYLIGECTVLRFTINDGIKDFYHVLINPGKIPLGYASDVKYGCTELCLEYPDMDNPITDLMEVLANIVDYLTEDKENGAKLLPPLYTLPEKQDQVQDFLSQVCRVAGEDCSRFRIYKLDLLFFYLLNGLKSRSNEGFPRESLALALLRKDLFKYTPNIGCAHHEENDKTIQCTTSRVKRWAYTVLDSCCPVAGVAAAPGRHVPSGLDIEEVLATVERKREEQRFPEARAPSSCASHDLSLGEPYDSSASVASGNIPWTKPVRSLQPLRKPNPATLNAQVVSAPELSEAAFPPLNLVSGGTDRRPRSNLTSDMGKMNLNN